MKAIILAGGIGSRLAPLTREIPKPLVSMVGKPIMECVIEHLRSFGITEIGVTLSHMPEKIMGYFGDGESLGVKLTYFIEEEPLGTAGSVKQAYDFVSDDFIVIAADAYTKIDIDELLRFHRAKRSAFTIAVVKRQEVKGLGVVETNGRGLVTRFVEKPERAEQRMSFVNTGIYIVTKGILKLIPDGFFDFGRDLLPNIIGLVYAKEMREYWSDIGTLESYYKTNLDIVSNNI